MEDINEYFKQEFPKKLREQLREHRIKRNLSQYDVAVAVGKSPYTYQRWESSGERLTDVFTLLSVFQELKFSTTEIIDVLGLRPLTLSEVETIYQDEDIMKSIKGRGIYSAMREKCADMDDTTLGKLLVLLTEENFKRLENRSGNK